MKTYMVGYDLKGPRQNYENLIEALKGYGTWWHCLDSTWFIKSDASAVVIRDTLRSHIDPSDKLLVVNVSGASAAWVGFEPSASDWLKQNL